MKRAAKQPSRARARGKTPTPRAAPRRKAATPVDAREWTVYPKLDPPAAEWVAPDKLRAWQGNPRKNDGEPVERVVASIKAFGFGAPIVARRGGEIIAGHTRWKAARQLGLDRVPVRYLDLDEKQAHKLALADNRLGELASWDTTELYAQLAAMTAIDVELLGWSAPDLRVLERMARASGDAQEDGPAGELPTDPITKPGDVWLLGKHRLACGDATSATDVARARGDLDPWLMVTDPPYGVDHDPSWRNTAIQHRVAGLQAKGLVENDDRVDWREAYKLFAGRVAYVWHGGRVASDVAAALLATGFEIRSQIIWAKSYIVFSRGHYHWQHEPCWYAARAGEGGADWVGDRKQSTLWTIEGMSFLGHTARDTPDNPVTGHSTQKPVECMARAMRNHGAAGWVVYDPFVGSGTSIVAAEQLDRVCVAVEVSPAYCDVAVERWQKFTGGKARRA